MGSDNVFQFCSLRLPPAGSTPSLPTITPFPDFAPKPWGFFSPDDSPSFFNCKSWHTASYSPSSCPWARCRLNSELCLLKRIHTEYRRVRTTLVVEKMHVGVGYWLEWGPGWMDGWMDGVVVVRMKRRGWVWGSFRRLTSNSFKLDMKHRETCNGSGRSEGLCPGLALLTCSCQLYLQCILLQPLVSLWRMALTTSRGRYTREWGLVLRNLLYQ